MPIYKEALNKARCGCVDEVLADDREVYFASHCHPTGKQFIKYNRATGNVVVECATCRKLIVEIAVANQPK